MNEKIKLPIEDQQLKALLKGLDDDIQVPFDASAAWRIAVK